MELEHDRLATTAVTRFELLVGARSDAQRASVLAPVEGVATLLPNAASADQAAAVRRRLDGEGVAIGMADALIAGITLQRRGILLTRNRRHFERVPGLALATLEDS